MANLTSKTTSTTSTRTKKTTSKPSQPRKATTTAKKTAPSTNVTPLFSANDAEIKKLRERYKALNATIDSWFEYLRQFIIGQDRALKQLLFIAYNNQYLNMLEDTTGIRVKRLTAVAVGPSGVGKTASIQRIAQIFNVPFVKYNATQLTSAGWVGNDVDSIITSLISAAGGNIERAERGIIFIDEIDKKVSCTTNGNSSGRDINGTAVQEELLKILEPSIIYVGRDGTPFDTHMLTVICGGRFIDIDKIREARLKGKPQLGFHAPSTLPPHKTDLDHDEDEDGLLIDERTREDYIPEDLISFGFIDEFVGRLTLIAEYKKLTPAVVQDIIFAEGSIYNQYLQVFASKGVDGYIDERVWANIALEIANSDTGARDLERKVIEVLMPALYDTEQHYGRGLFLIDRFRQYESLFETRTSKAPQDDIVYRMANKLDF